MSRAFVVSAIVLLSSLYIFLFIDVVRSSKGF